MQDFSSHFPSLVHCSLCRFVTCCATSYANHMINNHATSRKKIPPYLSIFFTNTRLSQTLRCVSCTFTACRGDTMARHLTEKQEHRCIVLTHNKLGVNGAEPQNQQQTHNPRSRQKSPYPNDFLSHPPPHPLASAVPLTAPASPWSSRPCATASRGLPPPPRHDAAGRRAARALLHRRRLRDRKWFWRTEKLAEWALSQREQQLSLSEDALLHTARAALGEDAEPADRYSWAADFVLRHELAARPAENAERRRRRRRGRLPQEAPEKTAAFHTPLSTQIQSRGVLPRCVGAMDEFSVFIDADRFSAQDPSALRLSGAAGDEPALDVVLSALGDGTLLPPLLFFRGAAARLPDGFPDNVLLQARRDGFRDSERLETWFHQV
ncbi:hypothetical protein EPR50_G00235270 [Perca flavescens]|uniref:HTH CENPB-type domain-containing protein n=1 Tax=Perca flavescens TaxID=8167 RepID=A0A484C501_PERFV|nr:hypothetical protein EPR50_G00235270 [Perca flavescens]